MAIIGDLESILQRHLQHVLNKEELNYIDSILNKNSLIIKRIFNLPLPSFDKKEISKTSFVLEQVYKTKEESLCFFESHKFYVDVQILLKGQESMGISDTKGLDFKSYEKNKDLVIYKHPKIIKTIDMSANDVAIFFPEDAHLGLLKSKHHSELCYKTVLKIPVNRWNLGKNI
jgi:biofilm protein TabA